MAIPDITGSPVQERRFPPLEEEEEENQLDLSEEDLTKSQGFTSASLCSDFKPLPKQGNRQQQRGSVKI